LQEKTKILLDISKEVARTALNKLSEIDKENNKQYFFDQVVPREIKAEADTIIEKIILNQLVPTGVDVLSEESGHIIGNSSLSPLRFIIDPIDGTVNFVRGIGSCSICIALYHGDKPLFGVIASYPSKTIAWGGSEFGAFLGKTKLEASDIKNSEEGILCTGFPSRFIFENDSYLSQMNMMSRFGKIRMLGAASQSLLQVAKGNAECYSEKNIMLWDVAAGIAIVEGAGGRVNMIKSTKSDGSLDVIVDNGSLLNGIITK